jgi:lysophospholipase
MDIKMRKITLILIFGLFLAIVAALFWPEKRYEPFEVSKAYQAQVDDFTVPPMPSDWTWGRFETADGTGLRWGETGNRGTADTTILIIPGYTATLKMYGEHADRLAERGFHIMGLDLRGQGGSDRHFPEQPEKLWVDDFGTYADDVDAFIKSQNFETERQIIPMAISFGGHVALRTAGEYPQIFDGLFLVAPAIEPKAGNMDFDKALGLMNFMRKIGQAKRYTPGGDNWKPFVEDYSISGIEHCSSNPKRLYLRDATFTNHPNERVGDVTNQWGAEFFESSLYIREDGFMENIETPVFIISADVDDFVSTETNVSVCSERLPDCQNKTYPGTGHCLPQESDEVVFDMLSQLESFVNSLRTELKP